MKHNEFDKLQIMVIIAVYNLMIKTPDDEINTHRHLRLGNKAYELG